MKYIDTDIMQISILSSEVVFASAREGVRIDLGNKQHVYQLARAYQSIENAMKNSYGMIIDRNSYYSIVPIEAYNSFNDFKRLKAIALVIDKERRYFPVEFEKDLYQGEIEIFETIQQARNWIEKRFRQSGDTVSTGGIH